MEYMPSIRPAAGELHYLHMVLPFMKGATSFEDLCKVPGHVQPLPTFHAAYLAQYLLEDDGKQQMLEGNAPLTSSSY